MVIIFQESNCPAYMMANTNRQWFATSNVENVWGLPVKKIQEGVITRIILERILEIVGKVCGRI